MRLTTVQTKPGLLPERLARPRRCPYSSYTRPRGPILCMEKPTLGGPQRLLLGSYCSQLLYPSQGYRTAQRPFYYRTKSPSDNQKGTKLGSREGL
jgi:hypothetical protein